MTELESKQPCEDTFFQPAVKSISDYKLGISNIIYQVSIVIDGNQWCALIGPDLQNGISGYGKTVQEALHNLADKIQESA